MSNVRNSSYINISSSNNNGSNGSSSSNNNSSSSRNSRSRSSNSRFSQRKKQHPLILHQELTLMAVCMTRFVTYCSALDPNLIAAL